MGTQVRIALGPRRVGGWVVEDPVEPTPGVVLRPLAAVRGWGPPPASAGAGRVGGLALGGAGAGVAGHRLVSDVAVRSLPAVGSPATPSRAARGAPTTRAAEVLGEGTTVVRLGPAGDRWPVVLAAVRRRERAGPDAGVLVLAPGLRAAADMARRLRSQGIATALLPGDWARARAGGCVVVGARAAAFAPVPRLAAAVVLDAHDEVYHEERAPTWAAWAVVAERARRDGRPVCAW